MSVTGRDRQKLGTLIRGSADLGRDYKMTEEDRRLPEWQKRYFADGVKGLIGYWGENASAAWKSYRAGQTGSGETQKPEPKPARKRLARRLSNNVSKRLIEGRNSRYLAAKADLAYRLDPSPETSGMASGAHLSVYNRTQRERDLQKHLVYASKPERMTTFREEIGRDVFTAEPSQAMLARVSRLAAVENGSPFGHMYLAVAKVRKFNDDPRFENDPKELEGERFSLLSGACDDIDRAAEMATEAEIPQVEYHAANVRRLFGDYKEHLRAKHLARDRDYVMSRVFTEPVVDVLQDAQHLAGRDILQPGISNTCAAVANIRKYVETREGDALNLASEYLRIAYETGKPEEMPFVEAHWANIRRIIEEAEKSGEQV